LKLAQTHITLCLIFYQINGDGEIRTRDRLVIKALSACSRVWLQLLFKVFFVPECIKMMFFYFKKIIFMTSTLKQSKTHKKN
jgi:TRAP-type mannitol/chloroaromatic compound transport system permease small subunit